MPKCRIVKEDRPGIVKMKDMQPLQIGRVDDSGSRHHGHLVLRTQSKEQIGRVDDSGSRHHGHLVLRTQSKEQIGRVDDSGSRHHGHLVLRTQSKEQFEVVDLTDFRGDYGWTTCSLGDKVRLLAPGKEVTLVLSND